VPPEPPLDAILWMIDEGKKDKLDESNKVLLRSLCWADKTTFLLPISPMLRKRYEMILLKHFQILLG
jgi:hypothetical protein